jgi:CheY-like chemotaxis protein
MNQPNLPSLKVLVVDDIASVRTLLRGQLRVFGINKIVEACDGITGLRFSVEKRSTSSSPIWQ